MRPVLRRMDLPLFRLSAFAHVVPSGGMPLVCLAISLLDSADAASPLWRSLPECTHTPPHQSEEPFSLSLLLSLYNLSRGPVSICLHV